MKFHHLRPRVGESSIPILLVDNYYNQDDCSFIEQELISSLPMLSGPEDTGSAKHGGDILKKNKGCWVDNASRLGKTIQENFIRHIPNELKAFDFHLFSLLLSSKHSDILISYYEDGDFYKPHADSSALTVISWFFKKPKNFIGGDFYFPVLDLKIDSLYNRTIIFPGCIKHSVLNIKQLSNQFGSGRFSITTFIS